LFETVDVLLNDRHDEKFLLARNEEHLIQVENIMMAAANKEVCSVRIYNRRGRFICSVLDGQMLGL
jgi:hypothetical protein